MTIAFQTLPFSSLTTSQLYALLKLRSEVFVVEQNIVYLDPDGYDLPSHHIFMHDGEMLAGCARIIPPGIKFPNAAIGRLAVAASHRGRRLGERLMVYAIEQTRALLGDVPITIEAQAHLRSFYESLGYETQTEPYMLEGIMHIQMLFPAGKPVNKKSPPVSREAS